MLKRMIKVPGPGEFRGEGKWEDFIEFGHKANLSPDEREEYWIELQTTRYLPTKVENSDV